MARTPPPPHLLTKYCFGYLALSVVLFLPYLLQEINMKNISTALVKAQRQFEPAFKTANNPHFRSKYADLSACIDAVKEALNDNGIYLLQKNYDCNDGVKLETIFVHESGEILETGIVHFPANKHDPQGFASCLTYARRYSLMSACGIAPEPEKQNVSFADDDGNASSLPKQPVAKKPIVLPPLAPNRLAGAIKQIKAGNYTTKTLRETFTLTPEQDAELVEALSNA
jgi:hypothetical protein